MQVERQARTQWRGRCVGRKVYRSFDNGTPGLFTSNIGRCDLRVKTTEVERSHHPVPLGETNQPVVCHAAGVEAPSAT